MISPRMAHGRECARRRAGRILTLQGGFTNTGSETRKVLKARADSAALRARQLIDHVPSLDSVELEIFDGFLLAHLESQSP